MHRRRPHSAALLALLLTLATACGEGEPAEVVTDRTAPETTQTTETTEVVEREDADADADAITRRDLPQFASQLTGAPSPKGIDIELTPTVGDRFETEQLMTMTMSVESGGVSQQSSQTTRTTTITEVTAADADGYTIRNEITEAELLDVDPASQRPLIEPTIGGMTETVIEIEFAPDGNPRAAALLRAPDMDSPLGAEFDELMEQMLDQMISGLAGFSAVFPDEPIAAGSTWEVTGEMNLLGMTVDLVSDFELVELDDTTLTVVGTQDISTDGEQRLDGMDGSIEMTSEGGSLEMVYDFTWPIPVSTAGSSAARNVIDVDGQPEMVQDIETETTQTTKRLD